VSNVTDGSACYQSVDDSEKYQLPLVTFYPKSETKIVINSPKKAIRLAMNNSINTFFLRFGNAFGRIQM